MKAHIEAAFSRAKDHGPTSLVSGPALCDVDVTPTKPLRPLAEQAAVLIRVAERRFARTVARYPLEQETYTIIEPRQPVDVAALMREAVGAIERNFPNLQKQFRHEIVEKPVKLRR